MDWSLVLISQGIEAIIQSPVGEQEWGLLVAPADYERARAAIAQYRVENRGWPWQQRWRRPAALFDWGSLAWVLLLVAFYHLSTRAGLHAIGEMSNRALGAGEWWRLFTATWLHADLAHLAGNAVVGFLLLAFVMGAYGTGTGLLGAYLAGVGGNLAVYLFGSSSHISLGASGTVMGALGLLAVHSFSLWQRGPHARKYIISGIAGGVMLFVLLGLAPDTDVLAHLGGFVCGVALGGLAGLGRHDRQERRGDFIAGLVFAVWVIVPWWLALRHGQG